MNQHFPEQTVTTDVVVVGAGPAGLAVGACLRERGIIPTVLEQGDRIAPVWHRHYDRLHLHTDKWTSALPELRFPPDYPRYPSRCQVIDYLNSYATTFGIEPRFRQQVTRISRQNGVWETVTDDTRYHSPAVVVAAGFAREPVIPAWPGMDEFEGETLHSSALCNGRPFRDQDVLVVGFGNSGGEIAIDLREHDARPSISVRSPVNLLPRDLLGIPILWIALALSNLPARLADALSAPVLRVTFGDLCKLGLRKLPYGPKEQIEQHKRIPLIDVGTVDLIRQGELPVYPGVQRFRDDEVVFADGSSRRFDAVVFATGYQPRVDPFLVDAARVADEHGCPHTSGRESKLPGLYFCGYSVAYAGMLREIGHEARAIAGCICEALSSRD
ncbi:NAD(P)/FAD-dependent oxidoreductase [soil metagenome]